MLYTECVQILYTKPMQILLEWGGLRRRAAAPWVPHGIRFSSVGVCVGAAVCTGAGPGANLPVPPPSVCPTNGEGAGCLPSSFAPSAKKCEK